MVWTMYSRVHIGGVPGAQFVDKVSCMYIFYIGRQSRRLNASFSIYIIRQEDQKISSMKRTTGCLWRQVCSSLPLEVNIYLNVVYVVLIPSHLLVGLMGLIFPREDWVAPEFGESTSRPDNRVCRI